ncbi:helix-turn-helix transcriptional regulator [Streptomyces tagetis]|nr:helix-turn-helix transcriptional regulator [Streptomyces sp. RG38]
MSPEELAHAAGASPGTVRKVEQGRRSAWRRCTPSPAHWR